MGLTMNVLRLWLSIAILVASSSTEAQGVTDARERIVGSWSAEKDGIVNLVTYLNGGTFRGHLLTASTGKVLWNYEGKYTFEGSCLQYTYTKSDSARVEVGYGSRDKVIEVDAEHFKIRTSTNEERIYTRVHR